MKMGHTFLNVEFSMVTLKITAAFERGISIMKGELSLKF